ncbi:CoA transferase [Rhodococcus sp. IEGM 1381]|uniref:CaiB/BaiF CoA transferase family protein n=1 Tax=Rhodococcus sp. IEGM 1381 TaxID=3047085 RepID=UPI0024B75153|nr:CoA transferase [Rhodococcus sp. IEGM 1381]MDI9897461.1 CoA transferase [Rhodococcus sp. IEGM 1381]
MVDILDNVRVLDFTQLEQGPSGTQVLADFGAEVIKIEKIDVGEIGRQHWPRVRGMSPHWAANNRNKLSLSIDLKNPESRAILDRLLETTDIVASNFRPGVMERLGLGHEQLSVINPRIISAYASGYGQTGPYRDRRGQDLVAQALGGLMALTGDQTTGPLASGTYAVDYMAAMHFAQGMLLALLARDRTGSGQIVDANLLSSAVAMHLQEGTTHLNTGRDYPRPTRGIAHSHTSALYATYGTRDSKALVLVGELFVDEPWQRVSRALGLSDEIANDPRFQTQDGLLANTEETYDILRQRLGEFDLDEALERFDSEDLLAAPVNDYEAVFNDPQVIHNGMIAETTHPQVGDIKLVGMPVRLSNTPGRVRTAPPSVGEHNEQILRSIGFTTEELRSWQKAGVVGSEAHDLTPEEDAQWG